MGSEPGPTAKKAGAFLMFNELQVVLITSAIFFTGGAPNSLMARLAKDTFKYNITWMNWFIAAVVPGLVSLLVIPWPGSGPRQAGCD
ncbi:MAG: 2-oxoglutarate/malate translocator [Firmicutes bacterium]|nr:2-oxoglutarate/malate translocator [Bacillota bacterium]